jgi:hypothetical protein
VGHGVPLNGVSISEQGRVDFTNPLRVVCEMLARTQIVVYPVAESTSGAAAALVTESEQTLEEFANITGGRMYRSGAVGDALHQAITDARSNYEIGYYSEAVKPDGKHHKLRVICTRKDVKLQTEQGFYALLAQPSPADVERNAFLYAANSPFDATDIGVRASASPDPAKSADMRFVIHIDPADLLLHQAQDHRVGKAALMFAAYTASGMVQTNPNPIDINLTAEQYEAATHDGIAVRFAIPISAGVQKVRVIVVDKEVGSAGSVTIPMGQ